MRGLEKQDFPGHADKFIVCTFSFPRVIPDLGVVFFFFPSLEFCILIVPIAQHE
jgi:hypothetical protein